MLINDLVIYYSFIHFLIQFHKTSDTFKYHLLLAVLKNTYIRLFFFTRMNLKNEEILK